MDFASTVDSQFLETHTKCGYIYKSSLADDKYRLLLSCVFCTKIFSQLENFLEHLLKHSAESIDGCMASMEEYNSFDTEGAIIKAEVVDSQSETLIPDSVFENPKDVNKKYTLDEGGNHFIITVSDTIKTEHPEDNLGPMVDFHEAETGVQNNYQFRVPPKNIMPKLLVDNEIMEKFTNQLATLTSEVFEMKNTVARQNFQLHSLMSEKFNSVSKDGATLDSKNAAQSSAISNVIGKQSGKLENIIKTQFSLPQYVDKFPLQNEKDLKDFEEEINDSNVAEMISSLKSIVSAGGLRRNLSSILSIDILLKFNVDGVHKKKRLWDFVKFIDILYCAVAKSKDYTRDEFKHDLRVAIKAAKNKYFKSKCLAKKPKKDVANTEI